MQLASLADALNLPGFLAAFCTPAAPGLPGEPVFLLNKLLKKLASTPSFAAAGPAIRRNNSMFLVQTVPHALR